MHTCFDLNIVGRICLTLPSEHAAVMPFEVKCKMVRSGESPVTHFALERFVTCVLSNVTGQFVTSCKLPAAILPRADVRLLPGVRPQVGLQVTRLCVAFAASGMPARVSGQLASRRPRFDTV